MVKKEGTLPAAFMVEPIQGEAGGTILDLIESNDIFFYIDAILYIIYIMIAQETILC